MIFLKWFCDNNISLTVGTGTSQSFWVCSHIFQCWWFREFNSIFFLFFNDFYFFHYSWFTVFCQFSPVQQSDPVTHTCKHSFSHVLLHHEWLDVVPCAIQQDLIAWFQCYHSRMTKQHMVVSVFIAEGER